MNAETPIRKGTRKATNVSLDARLIAAAREKGINVSRACEEGLRAELNRRWQEDNAEAIAASNAYIEKYGLPLDKYRMF